MKRTKHTALAFLLTLCIALELAAAWTPTAQAAQKYEFAFTPANGKLPSGWNGVNLYYWKNDSANNMAWPGVALEEENGVYSGFFTIDGAPDGFIINDGLTHGNGQTSDWQSKDLTFLTGAPIPVILQNNSEIGSCAITNVTYAVTLTGEGGVRFVNDSNAPITSDTAIDGQAFTAQIGEYDANNYEYAVTLKIGGAEVTPVPTPDSDGKITIPAEKITIAADNTDKTIVLTVGRTLGKFDVTTTENYVTGWTLVTIAKAEGRTDNPVYDYDGNATYYVDAYNAYAYLVSGAVTVTDATAKVTLGTAAAGTIAANSYDVNNTGKADYSDALLTYRCYEVVHQTPATAMETYLRADVDNSKKVDTTDVSAIDENRTPET